MDSVELPLDSRRSHRYADRVILTAWQKWRRYGRPPYKLFLHVLLVIVTTTQLVLYVESDAAIFRAMNRNFYYFLFPPEYAFDSTTFYLFTKDDVLDSVEHALGNVVNISLESVDRFSATQGISNLGDCGPQCGFLQVTSLLGNEDDLYTDRATRTTSSAIKAGGFREMFNCSLAENDFFARLVRMELSFWLTNYGLRCTNWEVSLLYDFASRGQVELELDTHFTSECDSQLTWDGLWNRLMWMNLLTIALAFAYGALSMRSLWRSVMLWKRLRCHYRSSSLSCSDRLRLFNPWLLIATVASACNMAYAISNLVFNADHAPVRLSQKLCAGLGCSLQWITMVGYLAHNRHYYTLVLTLNRAIPRVMRFLVGVLPVMLGYAFFGMLFFGDHSERFGNWGNSMITLFAVLNGDVIRETFMDLKVWLPFYPYTSQIYLYSFISIFIYVVLNVFIAIVEESFFATREKARSMAAFADTARHGRSVSLESEVGSSSRRWERLRGVLDGIEADDILAEEPPCRGAASISAESACTTKEPLLR